MLITFTGRKSGRLYTTPVNFIQLEDHLLTISLRKRTWWRNLRGGAHVQLKLKGKQIEANAEVYENLEDVADYLNEIIQLAPAYTKYLEIPIDDQDSPIDGALREAAKERVIIQTTLIS